MLLLIYILWTTTTKKQTTTKNHLKTFYQGVAIRVALFEFFLLEKEERFGLYLLFNNLGMRLQFPEIVFLMCDRHKIISWVFPSMCWCQSKQLVLTNCWTLYSWSNLGISALLSKQSCVPQFCQWSDKLLSCLNPSLLTPALGPSSCFFLLCLSFF